MLAYDIAKFPPNNNEWSFPPVEIAFTLSIGTVALVDLRPLGAALLSKPPSQVAKDAAPWTLVGLVIMLISGPYVPSQPSFVFKMWALLIAIVFHYTIHRKVALSSRLPASFSKLIAAVSLAADFSGCGRSVYRVRVGRGRTHSRICIASKILAAKVTAPNTTCATLTTMSAGELSELTIRIVNAANPRKT